MFIKSPRLRRHKLKNKKGLGWTLDSPAYQLMTVGSHVPTASPILKRQWGNHPEEEAVHVKEMSKRAPSQPPKKQLSCWPTRQPSTPAPQQLLTHRALLRESFIVLPGIFTALRAGQNWKLRRRPRDWMKAAGDTQNIYVPDLTLPWSLVCPSKHSGILSHTGHLHICLLERFFPQIAAHQQLAPPLASNLHLSHLLSEAFPGHPI